MPSRRVGHSCPGPANGIAGDVALGFGRPAGEWPFSDHRRPGGSAWAVAEQPPALPLTTAVSDAPATALLATHRLPRFFRRDLRRLRGHSASPSCSAAGGGLLSCCFCPNLPVHPAPERCAVLLLRLDDGLEAALLVTPHIQQRLMLFLMEDRERCDDIRKWRTCRSLHDGSGSPVSFPGFGTSVTMSMIRKEEEGFGLTAAGFYSAFRTQTESCATSTQYNIMHRQYKLGAL